MSTLDSDLRTRLEALARKWDDTRCGVMSPGLHRAADELRASLPNKPPEQVDLQTRSGHFTGGLITDDNTRGVRFVEDDAGRSRPPADTDETRPASGISQSWHPMDDPYTRSRPPTDTGGSHE